MRQGNSGGKERRVSKSGEKTNENSGRYVIASSRPPEQRPLECRTLVPKTFLVNERAKNLSTPRWKFCLDIAGTDVFQAVWASRSEPLQVVTEFPPSATRSVCF